MTDATLKEVEHRQNAADRVGIEDAGSGKAAISMATANMDRMDPAAKLLSVTKAGATQSGPAQTATGIKEAAGKDQAAPKHPELQHLSVEQPSQPNSSRAEGAASECEKGSSSQGQAATGGAQDQPARIQLAVADWSPFGCGSGSLPEPEPEPELDAGVQDQPVRGRVPHADWRQPQGGQQWASSAGGSTTESDSGKDAAEVFVSRGARLSQGYKFKQQARSQTRKRPAKSPVEMAAGSPRKRRARTSEAESESKDEFEAVAALEQIKHTEPSSFPQRSSAPPTPPPAAVTAASALAGAAAHFPAGALQALARLMQQQQLVARHAVPHLQQSPFQGQPASPNSSIPAGLLLQDLKAGSMRTCFSETSAERLLGAPAKAQADMHKLPRIIEAAKESCRLARPTGLQPGSVQPPVGGSFASVKGRAASQPLPGGIVPPPGFPTLHSNTASDTAFAAGSVLGLHRDPLGSTPADRGLVDGPRPQTACVSSTPMPHTASERGQPLDSFGSLISNQGDGQFRKGPIKGTSAAPSNHADVSMARASSMPFKSEGYGQATLFGQRSKPGQAVPKQASGFTTLSSPAKDGATAVGSAAVTLAQAPDPRILDWVLGSRGSLADKGLVRPSTSIAQLGNPPPPEVDSFFPRTISADASHHAEDAPKASLVQSSTLRRPIAIRAKGMQDSLPGRTRSEGVLEGLFGRIGATAAAPVPPPPVSAPMAMTEGSPAPSLRLTELALLAQQTLTNGDLGRVMQWAGTELALRDKKVREAERQRDEERKAHDAAMTAVGTEVARLKRGQAELAITHWNLQESLSHKDAELAEKNKLIQQLTEGIQEGLRAARERQRLQAENDRLRGQLTGRYAELLAEVQQVEEATKVEASIQEVTLMLQSLRTKLQTASEVEEEPHQPQQSRLTESAAKI